MIKEILEKIKKNVTWHLYPKPDDLNLKSVVEFVFYLFITLLLLLIFFYWHKVPERNIVLVVDNVKCNLKIPADSAISTNANICLNIPMTNRESNNNEGFSTSFSFYGKIINKKDKDSIDRIKDSILILTTGTESDLYKEINLSNRTKILDNFLESHQDLNNNIFYFAYGYNKSEINSYNQKPYLNYIASKFDNSEDSLGMLSYVTSTKKYFCRSEFYISKTFGLEQQNIYSRGELGGPIWYRFEDISQSYYNIRLCTNSIDSLTLKLDFNGVVDFSNMIPEPDIKGMGFIEFQNQDKIRQIQQNGLQFYGKFKELENMQTVRLLAVTTILGGIIILYVAVFFIACYHFFRWMRNNIIKGILILTIIILIIFYFFHLLDPLLHP